MSASQYMILLAVIYLAPHVEVKLAHGLAVFLMICSAVFFLISQTGKP
jgi:hypothetical protein